LSETVYIGLGSNVGEREHHLARAVDCLSQIDAVAVARRSSLYDSAPFGPPQARYLNAVVQVECGLGPQRLLGILKQIEADLGRQPTSSKWGPRTIDLDLLLWDGRLVADPNLQIPHLELHKRRFVLEPLCELAPEVEHPMFHDTVRSLLHRLDAQDVVRIQSTRWPGTPDERDAR
jgi:2-amino-4-hydroxy-6-hydroxymethyldihydropteridine diphosphokinase